MYIFVIICLAALVLYYLNFNPFIRNPEPVEDGVSDIEISINELKNLNQYIDNGITNHPAI